MKEFHDLRNRLGPFPEEDDHSDEPDLDPSGHKIYYADEPIQNGAESGSDSD